MKLTPAKILLSFGAFLIVAGFLGWASTGFTDRGKTAIMMGAGSGILILITGFLAGRAGALGTVARWAGVVFSGLFGGTFAWRASIAWQDPTKLSTAILLTSMGIAALATVILAGRKTDSAPESAAV